MFPFNIHHFPTYTYVVLHAFFPFLRTKLEAFQEEAAK